MAFFGIYRRDQLTLKALTGSVGQTKRIAITLFPEIAKSDDPDRDLLLEYILLWFSAENRTYKRTYRDRFESVDEQVVQFLEDGDFPRRGLEVHDIAVSDGRSAVDFFQRLEALEDFEPIFLATDRDPDVMALSRPGSHLVAVVDPESHALLQIIRPPFVFNNEKRRFRPVGKLIRNTLLHTEVRALLKRLETNHPSLEVNRIRLLAPELLQLLETMPRFRFERSDVLEPMQHRFHLIRAMNILNRSYFTESELRLAVQNIRESLRLGGLFVTGSNQDAGSTVDGAIYQRVEGGFRRLWVSGSGSPVDGLVLETPTHRREVLPNADAPPLR